MNPAGKVTSIAKECFEDNIVFSFVGGSYATGQTKPSSDVDLFVLLKYPMLENERRFAKCYQDLHQKHGLKMGHCGEIFDRHTLEHLLQITKYVLELVPLILDLGCYQSDCILSIFRKGDVVMKLLADPKICVWGDRKLLLEFEEHAHSYFDKHSVPRIQTEIGHLSYSRTSESDVETHRLRLYYENQCKGGNYSETPVGIGLERWFGDWLDVPPLVCSQLPKTSGESVFTRNMCPYSVFPRGSLEDFCLKYQCLGSYYGRFSCGQ